MNCPRISSATSIISAVLIGLTCQGCVVLLPFIESDLPSSHRPDAASEAPACGSYQPSKSSHATPSTRPLSSKQPVAKEQKKQSEIESSEIRTTEKKVLAVLKPSEDKVVILVRQLKDGDDVRRTHAATDLGFLGRDALGAVKPLANALKNDQSKWVRRAAAKSLGKLGTPVAIDALRAALKDKNKWVAHSAERALGRLLLQARLPIASEA